MFEERKAKKALQELSPALEALDVQLKQVEQIADPLDRIVRFFDTVSRFNDGQKDAPVSVSKVLDAFRKTSGKGENAQAIEALQALQSHFNNAGRDEFGMNRTQPGEAVTGDKVYLGNTHGLWTFTANDWREKLNRDTPYAKDDRQIIEGQAAGFVASHAPKVHQYVATLAKLKP